MGNTTKEKIDERKIKILNTAFDIFVEKTIEAVSMGEIAEAAGVGRATLFRYYPSKLELVIEVCGKKWKDVFDELDRCRPISSVGEIPALDRLIFTLISHSIRIIKSCFVIMIILTITFPAWGRIMSGWLSSMNRYIL